MDPPDKLIKDQFISEKCKDRILDHVFIDDLDGKEARRLAIKNRRKVCDNTETPSGIDFREYAPNHISYLKEKDKIYCFTLEELKTYQRAKSNVNPYTGKSFPASFINDEIVRLKHIRKSVPIGFQIDTLDFIGKGKCPIFRSKDPLKVYTTAKEPWETAAKNKLQIAEFRGYQIDSYGVDYVFWEVNLKKPLTSSKIDIDNIISMKKVASSQVFGNPIKVKKKVKIYGDVLWILQRYTSRQFTDISKENIEKVMNYKGIRPAGSIKVYRGLSFSHLIKPPKWMYNEPYILAGFKKLSRRPVDFISQVNNSKPIELGQTLTLESRGNVESWTTNPCIAFGYAYSDGNFGIVVEYTANPNEILMDGNYVENIKDIYRYNQQEVILKTSTTRKVKVHTLVVEGNLFANRSFDGKGKYQNLPYEDDEIIKYRNQKIPK